MTSKLFVHAKALSSQRKIIKKKFSSELGVFAPLRETFLVPSQKCAFQGI